MSRLLLASVLLVAACAKQTHDATSPIVADPIGDAAPPAAKPGLPKRLELADVDRYSFGLAADASHVYWVDYHGGGGVFRARKDGGGRDRLAPEQPFTRDVAVDDRFVYWAQNTAANGAPPGAIMRVPKLGGAPEAFALAQWNPDRVLVHRGHLLWNAEPPGTIMRAPAAGAPTVAIKAAVSLLHLRGDELFFVDHEGRLQHAPALGGTPEDIVKLARVPIDLAADEAFVYFADAGAPVMPPSTPCPKGVPCPVATATPNWPGGEIVRVPISGGVPARLASDLNHVTHVAVDATWVYFTSRAGLQRVAKDGKGSVETLEPEHGFASRLLVDEDRIVFQNGQKLVSLQR